MSRASRVAAKDLPVGTQRIRTSVWTYQSCRTRLFQSSAYFRSFHLVLRPFPKTTIRLYASFFCSHLSPSFRATTICVAFRKDGNTQKSPSDTIQKTSTLLNYHDLNVSRQNIPIALQFWRVKQVIAKLERCPLREKLTLVDSLFLCLVF